MLAVNVILWSEDPKVIDWLRLWAAVRAIFLVELSLNPATLCLRSAKKAHQGVSSLLNMIQVIVYCYVNIEAWSNFQLSLLWICYVSDFSSMHAYIRIPFYQHWQHELKTHQTMWCLLALGRWWIHLPPWDISSTSFGNNNAILVMILDLGWICLAVRHSFSSPRGY